MDQIGQFERHFGNSRPRDYEYGQDQRDQERQGHLDTQDQERGQAGRRELHVPNQLETNDLQSKKITV